VVEQDRKDRYGPEAIDLGAIIHGHQWSLFKELCRHLTRQMTAFLSW